MRRWFVLAAAILLVVESAETEAQEIRRVGRGEPRLDARIDEVIRSAEYRLLIRDTTVAATDTLRGPVVVTGARVILEGTLRGNLVAIDANVYLRPGARVVGDILNIAGGLYRSEQVAIEGSVDDYPLAPYHVEREGERITIVGDVDREVIDFDGLFGFTPPTANRVDGIKPRWGAALMLPALGRLQPSVYGWTAYATERQGFDEGLHGGLELRLRRNLNTLALGGERLTMTNDWWIRPDLRNTLSFLWNGKDYRNYYDARRVYADFSRDLVRGNHAARAFLRAQREDAATLLTGDPWVLLDPDSLRANPPVDDGVISSALLGASGEWAGATSVAEYSGALEWAARDALDGDFGFGAFALWGEWAMKALANHTLEFETRLQGPLPGTELLPRQRWGMLGGSGTLYTFDIGDFRGDRVVFFRTLYSIPLPERVALPFIGAPDLEFFHTAGMAWTHVQDRQFEQNIGLRVRYSVVHLRLVTNPADFADDFEWSVGLSWPSSRYPWQPARRNPLQRRP